MQRVAAAPSPRSRLLTEAKPAVQRFTSGFGIQEIALRAERRTRVKRHSKRFGVVIRPTPEHSGRSSMYHEAIEKVSKQVLIRERYDNFIGGKWVAPVEGRYFDNPSPVTGKRLCSVPRSSAADIELALDAAHKAKDAWGKTSVAERSRHPEQNRGQAAGQSRSAGAGRDARQWQADPRDRPMPTCRWWSITGAISPAWCGPRKAASPRSITTPWPITITSRSAWSARSFPGISRS